MLNWIRTLVKSKCKEDFIFQDLVLNRISFHIELTLIDHFKWLKTQSVIKSDTGEVLIKARHLSVLLVEGAGGGKWCGGAKPDSDKSDIMQYLRECKNLSSCLNNVDGNIVFDPYKFGTPVFDSVAWILLKM